MTKCTKERILLRADGIDLLKGIGIILVVIGLSCEHKRFSDSMALYIPYVTVFCIVSLHTIQIWKVYYFSKIFVEAD